MRSRSAVAVLVLVSCRPSPSSPPPTTADSGPPPAADPASSAASGGVAVTGAGTFHAGCRIFPPDNPWNTDVSALPVNAALMGSVMPKMQGGRGIHPDWGTFADQYGIPITTGKAAPPVPVAFHTSYGAAESDKAPCPSPASGEHCYPIPRDAKIEGGSGAPMDSDRHVLFLANDGARDHCILYELYNARPEGAGWSAGSAAIFRLDSNALRPERWTSADAAGLPVLAGLVRREEVERGEIPHALRFTMSRTRDAYIHPATHAAGQPDPTLPPMGLRVRLRASFDESRFQDAALVIVKAMKRYGMILADNGSDWFVSGETNDRWDMGALNEQLGRVKGSDFEILDTGPVVAQRD